MSPLGLRSAKKKKEGEEAAAKPAKPPKPAKPAKPAAPPSAARGVVVEKPKADIYTVLLILSFVALVIGCLALYLEMRGYDMSFKARL